VLGEIKVMGLLTPFIATTIGGWIDLLVFFALIFLNYWAISRIIKQAGYASIWILLPLAPLLLTVLSFIIFWSDVHTIIFGGTLGFGGVNSIGVVWHLDQLSIFLNWIFFLVFAFSRWPGSGSGYSRPVDGPRPAEAMRANSGPASVPPTPTAAAPRPRVNPSSAAGPGSGPTDVPSIPIPKGPKAQFCAWCGESLPGNRALFHDCGPKDRPEAFCKNCGTAMSAGASSCSACGAS
jgi:hypothetical protein